MRKVKVLAFVLAALMVVAAFAGCGTKDIKADVTTLDERVTALEALLKQVNDTVNGGATKDDITEILDAITANKAEAAAGDKTLADAIAKITADQATANAALKADLEKLVDAAKKDQAAGDTALQVAIEKLNNSIDATNKALEDAIKELEKDIADGDKATLDAVKELLDDQSKDISDALADLKESIDKNKEEAGVNASVQAKISAYVSNLTTAKTTYDFEEHHYTTSDFAAIEKALSNGIASIQAATTVEAVDAAYAAVVAELAKYERVDVALYKAYNALLNKINLDSKDAIKAYSDRLSAAQSHYGEDAASVLNAYEYASGKKAKLIDAATDFTRTYTYLTTDLIYQIYSVDKQIANIGRVQYLPLYTSADEDYVADNVKTVATVNTTYSNVKKTISDNNYSSYAKYLDDSLVNLVTNKDVIAAHVNTVNALTKAAVLLDTYASYNDQGGYNNVFGEYTALGAKKDWWENEGKYNTVNSRIKAWLADNPAVDAKNAEAILDDYLGAPKAYATYLENEAMMKLHVAKFNEFKTEFVPRIKAVNKFTEISTENFKVYAELVEDLKEWLVVIPDEDDDGKDEEVVINKAGVITATKADDSVISGTQYQKMLQKAFGDNNYKVTFKITDTAVNNFFITVVAKAQAVADYINEFKIAPLAASTTELSIEKFKTLEGYEKDKVTEIYSIPAPVADAGDDAAYEARMAALFDSNGDVVTTVNIAQFEHAFTRTVIQADAVYSYDLTYLLDLDALEAAQKATEARIAEIEKLTSAINASLDAIKLDLAAVLEAKTGEKVKIDELSGDDYNKLLNTVNLNNKSAVDALKKAYTSLISTGFKHDATRKWVAVTDEAENVIPGQYYNVQLLSTTAIHEITGLVGIVDDLNSMATNINKFMKAVADANAFKAFTVKDMDEHCAVVSYSLKTENYTDPDTGLAATKKTYTWGYVKNTSKLGTTVRSFKVDSNGATTTTTAYASSTQPKNTLDGKTINISGAYTQLKAVEVVWEAYYAFLKDNQGNTYASVETALKDYGMEALRLQALKALAYNEINGVSASAATKWKPEFGNFAKAKEAQLSAVANASSIEAVANILYSFYEMTGAPYAQIKFAGVLYFHTDGTFHIVETEKVKCDHDDHKAPVNP